MSLLDLPPPEHLSRTPEVDLNDDDELEQARLQKQLAAMDLPEPEWVRDAAARKDQGLGEKGKAEGLAQEWEGMDMQEPEWLKGGCVDLFFLHLAFSSLLVDARREAWSSRDHQSCVPLRRPSPSLKPPAFPRF